MTLTPYDMGHVFEPKVWVKDGLTGNEIVRPSERDDYGKVDFDDDEGATVLTLSVRPTADPIAGEATVIDVSIPEGQRVRFMINGATVWLGTALIP